MIIIKYNAMNKLQIQSGHLGRTETTVTDATQAARRYQGRLQTISRGVSSGQGACREGHKLIGKGQQIIRTIAFNGNANSIVESLGTHHLVFLKQFIKFCVANVGIKRSSMFPDPVGQQTE